MDPLIREDDKTVKQVRPFDKLRDRVTKAQNLKVQMEWLQWGFPMATALSSNTLASINRKYTEGKQRMDPRIREDDKSAVRGPTPG